MKAGHHTFDIGRLAQDVAFVLQGDHMGKIGILGQCRLRKPRLDLRTNIEKPDPVRLAGENVVIDKRNIFIIAPALPFMQQCLEPGPFQSRMGRTDINPMLRL